MPADLAELAKEVAELHVGHMEFENLEGRIHELEERLVAIEERLSN